MIIIIVLKIITMIILNVVFHGHGYDADSCTENENIDNIECGFAWSLVHTQHHYCRREGASQLALLPQFLSQPDLEKVNLDFSFP